MIEFVVLSINLIIVVQGNSFSVGLIDDSDAFKTIYTTILKLFIYLQMP